MNILSESFESALADPERSVILDLSVPGGAMLIAFGGFAGAMAIPPFEFFGVASEIPVNRVFVRDLQCSWYHRGAPGLGRTIDEIAGSLRRLIEQERPSRVVTTGSCAGGYAALLFGSLIGADAVVAFAPRTYLGRGLRVRHLDYRAIREMWPLYDRSVGDRRYFDLKRVLAAGAERSNTDCRVYVSTASRIDMANARRLRGLPNLVMSEHDEGGHRLVRALRDRGELGPIRKDALFGSPAAMPADVAASA